MGEKNYIGTYPFLIGTLCNMLICIFLFLFRQLTDLGVKIAVWDINLEAAEAAVR